jgi:hypothetical protein
MSTTHITFSDPNNQRVLSLIVWEKAQTAPFLHSTRSTKKKKTRKKFLRYHLSEYP